MSGRIMIVEDEVLLSIVYQAELERIGYEVLTPVISGEEAIQLAEEERPDVILMDINLYGMLNGIETGRIIKSKYSIPIIFITGYADKKTEEQANSVSHYGYFVKPVDIVMLKPTIDKALNEK